MTIEMRIAGILLACIGLGVYMLVRLVLWDIFGDEDAQENSENKGAQRKGLPCI